MGYGPPYEAKLRSLIPEITDLLYSGDVNALERMLMRVREIWGEGNTPKDTINEADIAELERLKRGTGKGPDPTFRFQYTSAVEKLHRSVRMSISMYR